MLRPLDKCETVWWRKCRLKTLWRVWNCGSSRNNLKGRRGSTRTVTEEGLLNIYWNKRRRKWFFILYGSYLESPPFSSNDGIPAFKFQQLDCALSQFLQKRFQVLLWEAFVQSVVFICQQWRQAHAQFRISLKKNFMEAKKKVSGTQIPRISIICCCRSGSCSETLS